MEEELNAIARNNTRELVKLPTEKKTIEVKWAFKVKLKTESSGPSQQCEEE
ncbi:hypothetical protein A2U01_0079563, partial [Trifolium medium]|nr:hypothetical protein [Trifolium medium]